MVVQMMVMMYDDGVGVGSEGDHDGSKETPPYWTVTFYPTIGNKSEGSRRYFVVVGNRIDYFECQKIKSKRLKSTLLFCFEG